MARCWVLRKRAGPVLLLHVLCAVRVTSVGGGAGLSLFSGLLLRLRVGRAQCCCHLLVGWRWCGCGRCGGVVGGSGLRASNRSAGCSPGGVFRDCSCG